MNLSIGKIVDITLNLCEELVATLNPLIELFVAFALSKYNCKVGFDIRFCAYKFWHKE